MFPCSRCGACCRVINCQFLTSDNLCSIYAMRPFLCRVDSVYELYYRDIMTLDEYYYQSELACGSLRRQEQYFEISSSN